MATKSEALINEQRRILINAIDNVLKCINNKERNKKRKLVNKQIKEKLCL